MSFGQKYTQQDCLDLAATKLASSGLTVEDGIKLGIQVPTPSATHRLCHSFKTKPALKLNYFFPDGSPMVLHGFYGIPFYRLRYLYGVESQTRLDKKTKRLRYVQEPGSGVGAYFPQLINWDEIIFNTDQPLIITEGELKAAKACKEGFPTIGLGGVYNFRSELTGFMLLPELSCSPLYRRYIYIAYDSDFRTNPRICGAINQLAELLIMEGAIPYVVYIPPINNDKKTGLDDYLVQYGKDAFEKALRNARPFAEAKALHNMNKTIAYVHTPPSYVRLDDGAVLTDAHFNMAYSRQHFAKTEVQQDGTTAHKLASLGKEWRKWPQRLEIDSLAYEPGKPPMQIVADQNKKRLYNFWPGWGVEPKSGPIDPFIKLFRHLTKGLEHEARRWFLQWLAFPLQYPGTKLFTSVLFHGRGQGTGKTLLGITMGRIYGKNYSFIKEKGVIGSFNSWAKHKQFVLGDDITGSDKRQETGELRALITQDTITINEKYTPAYTIRDCINYFFTSNLADAFFLEDLDRRFFIHEATVSPLSSDFYKLYDTWMNGNEIGHLFHFLLNVDTSDFDPSAPAPRTAAKERMIADTKSDIGDWIAGLLRTPDTYLSIGDTPLTQDIFSSRELKELYDPANTSRVTANGVGRELKRAGVRHVNKGIPILHNGTQERYYAIRRPHKWLYASAEELRAHLEKHSGHVAEKPPLKPKKY